MYSRVTKTRKILIMINRETHVKKDHTKCQTSKFPPIFILKDISDGLEAAFGVAWKALNTNEGYLTLDGRIVVAYDADGDLPPSVASVVRWLHENTDGYMTIQCALDIGMPHLQQLRVSVQELVDHRIVELVVDKGRAVFYLTDKGDAYAEELPNAPEKKLPPHKDIGGLFE